MTKVSQEYNFVTSDTFLFCNLVSSDTCLCIAGWRGKSATKESLECNFVNSSQSLLIVFRSVSTLVL